jgi:hypothetical protein
MNLTCPPGFTLISDPFYVFPNNDLINEIDNTLGYYNGCQVLFWQNGTWVTDTANNNPTPPGTATNGWVEPHGPMSLPPGGGAAFYNPCNASLTITFVGTVGSGVLPNTLNPGLNLVSSIIPASGDLSTNTLMSFPSLAGGQFDGDQLFLMFNSGNGSSGYTTYTVDSLNYNPPGNHGWDGLPGQPDPVLNFGQAFWYRAGNRAVPWTENYTVNGSDIVTPKVVQAKTSAAVSSAAISLDAVQSPAMSKSRHCQLTWTGRAGKTHVVEASSDLKKWKPVGTNFWPSGKFIYADPVPATNNLRFYRSFALP